MKRLVVVLAVSVLAVAAVAWFATEPARIAASALPPHAPDLGNGRTMFFAGGCASCHAGSAEEPTRLGGGGALRSPFGTFHAPNISPHPTDGIGRWSEADFVTAVIRGTSPEGRHYYPAFPSGSYQRMAVADVRDLFAFLKTLPAVAGRAPFHQLPFPYSIRRAVGIWKLLYLDGRPFVHDSSLSEAWNRGAYLVNGPGHCAECHSPRTALGGIVAAKRFTGGPNPEGKGRVPNITQSADGLGKWSEREIVEVLTSGFTPEFDSVGGAMAAVVRNTARLPEADRRAMATYLKSLPALAGDGAPR